METKRKIIWIDDEIELLRSHILFLNEKGYEVTSVTNGDDAIGLISKNDFDLVFLDEMMPGKDGLQTLSEIKEIKPFLPVVMITKNEEESLMEEAIGGKIADYLTKPINPSQILIACKKIIDSKKIISEQVSKEYSVKFNEINQKLIKGLNQDEWIDLYSEIVNWEMELDEHPELGLNAMLHDQKKECNSEFCKFYLKNYKNWISSKTNRPTLSVDILEKYIQPKIENNEKVVFIVVDCMRLDQWMVMEKYLSNYFNIKKDFYFSILPTATPYARNAIFSGLYPLEISEKYPEFWIPENDEMESSLNKFEKELLEKYFERKRCKINGEMKYYKIIDAEYGKNLLRNSHSIQNNQMTSIVINFVDMLAHHRSDSALLKEIAPDEPAYRSLTNSWFKHSMLYELLQNLSSKNLKIVITTDHGSIKCNRGTKVLAEKEASKNLRYKFGRNLKVDEKQSFYIRNPKEFNLPQYSVTTNFAIALEDYFYIYPNDYHKFLSLYKDSFQHGGISLEEVIVPIIELQGK